MPAAELGLDTALFGQIELGYKLGGGDRSDHHFIICLFNNEDPKQVTGEQWVMEGDPKFKVSQRIPEVPYHRFPEVIGLMGLVVDRPETLGGAWGEALASDRPVLLDVKTDPEVPPLPPHFAFKQIRNMAAKLAKGDPNQAGGKRSRRRVGATCHI